MKNGDALKPWWRVEYNDGGGWYPHKNKFSTELGALMFATACRKRHPQRIYRVIPGSLTTS